MGPNRLHYFNKGRSLYQDINFLMALISMFYPYDILPKPSLIITLRQGPWGQYILFEKKLVLFKFGLGKWSWAMGPKVVNFLKRTCNSALIYMTSLIFSQQTLYILYKLQRWLTAKICGTIHNTPRNYGQIVYFVFILSAFGSVHTNLIFVYYYTQTKMLY